MEAQSNLNLHPFITDAVAGFVGGTALVYSSQPFDTVKTKLQSFPQLYKNSMLTCFRQTVKQEGVFKGLYRGSIPAIAVNGLENMVLFVAYEQLQKSFKPEKTYQLALCGSASSFLSSLVVCPTELVKIRLQASYELGTKKESLGQLVKKIIYEKPNFPGAGLFQGLTSCWCREIPGYFFFFYGKEIIREIDCLKNQSEEIRAVVSGTLAGILFWSAMLPVDNIKTNMQVKVGLNFSDLLMKSLKTNPMSLYNGYSATILRAIPANIALFYTYDVVKNYLTKL